MISPERSQPFVLDLAVGAGFGGAARSAAATSMIGVRRIDGFDSKMRYSKMRCVRAGESDR
jgi:hypothetical protein